MEAINILKLKKYMTLLVMKPGKGPSPSPQPQQAQGGGWNAAQPLRSTGRGWQQPAATQQPAPTPTSLLEAGTGTTSSSRGRFSATLGD